MLSTMQLRHVFGVETKGAKPVFNLSPLLKSLDGPILAASSSFWAIPWVGGGGPVYVSTMSASGKVRARPVMYPAPARAKAQSKGRQFLYGEGVLLRVADTFLTVRQGYFPFRCSLTWRQRDETVHWTEGEV